ncbi:GNAT family N-acetyltransferase [Knoellia sp. CPCC 206450]|uniref:GNAT family N-acetyltransferase n=1 Tax=Knoellia tibetensis TaxID=3404798 RepID=UPI003B4382C5
MAVRIVPVTTLDPAPEAAALAEQWNDVLVASTVATMGDDHDAWSLASRRARESSTSWDHRYFAAVDEGDRLDGGDGVGGVDGGAGHGTVVAAAELVLPRRDNLTLALLDLAVRPDHRRRGTGTLVLDHLVRLAQEAGRTTLLTETAYPSGGSNPGEAFLRTHGFEVGQTMQRNDLDVRSHLPGAVALLDGYAIETSTDDTLDEWLEDRAHLSRRMSTDAPVGDLDLAEEDWDADRVREQRDATRRSNRRAVESVARHLGTGRLVAFTQLQVPVAEPVLAYQQDTLVLREHRGHGLGQALKSANLRAARETFPEIATVRTWNAQENGPMIAVNEALGYRTTAVQREWQRRLG